MELTQATYRVAISINRRTASPFRVTEVQAERAREIIDSFLSAWGIPVPRDVQDAATFVQGLTEAGEYRHESGHYWIIVERNA